MSAHDDSSPENGPPPASAANTNDHLDGDLTRMTREQLIAEARRLRAGIREHRDSSGQNLCWHHPQLWGLLPEPIPENIAVPPWPRFLRGCVKYRESLDRELPGAPVSQDDYD
jgi:hypothetical protein